MPRVIITRPQREAQRWVRDLTTLGLDTQCLPLIVIAETAQPAQLTRAWQQLGSYLAVMFVSGNAVTHFFSAPGARAAEFAAQADLRTRAWATGPGTAKALLHATVAPERIDAPAADAGQFDSEALWRRVAAQVHPSARVLIVRGADTADDTGAQTGSGRPWFAEQVLAAGGVVDFVAAYQRRAPDFSTAEHALARQAAGDGSVWLFSSAQAVANLHTALPGQNWAAAHALATHPRIADAVREAGFGVVLESRPTLPDVAAALQQHFRTLK